MTKKKASSTKRFLIIFSVSLRDIAAGNKVSVQGARLAESAPVITETPVAFVVELEIPADPPLKERGNGKTIGSERFQVNLHSTDSTK